MPKPSHAEKQSLTNSPDQDPLISDSQNVENYDEVVPNVKNSSEDHVKPVQNPIVGSEHAKKLTECEINTTVLRRSHRTNKGVNNRLTDTFQVYSLCCHCIKHEMCHLSFRNNFPTSCGGGGGGIANVDTSLPKNDCR